MSVKYDFALAQRARRLASGLRTKDVAAAMGVRYSVVVTLENGQRVWRPHLLAGYDRAVGELTGVGVPG